MSSKKRTRSAPKPHSSAAEKQAAYKRHRAQNQDYSNHAFLDASATVHAGLFAARRLPEIKSLWRDLVNEEIQTGGDTNVRRVGKSGGGKISSRHLRRRTGSHRPRRRHRFPRGDVECSSTDGESRISNSESKLDILDTSSVSKQSLDSQLAKKQLNKSTPCRRARRKPALLKASHSTWWNPSQSFPHPSTETQSKHKWIPTHHWHAKRFHMASLFGWSIPLVHCNRGCRASLRLAKEKCTVQDASWEIDGCAVVLRIEKAKVDTNPLLFEIVRLLQRICGADSSFLRDEDVLRGNKVGEGLIYEVDSFPMKLVGPASFRFQGDSEASSASIMVHPSIRLKVQSILESVISNIVDFRATVSTTPLSLLRIRGAESVSALANVLSIDCSMLMRTCKSEDKNDAGVCNDELLSHASLIEYDASGLLSECPIQSSIRQHQAAGLGHAVSDLDPLKLRIIAHRPNAHLNTKDLPHNTACTGFDILCHPSALSEIFESFIMKESCPIGYMEDSRAQLEAFPPLPVFPRDYPDTTQGRLYWEGLPTDLEKDKSIDCIDWAVARTCLEAPWGRMNIQKVLRSSELLNNNRNKHKAEHKASDDAKVDKVDTESQDILIKSKSCLGKNTNMIKWDLLLPSPRDNCFIVVVRGSFGHPFLSILNGYGKFKSVQFDKSKKHKRRRSYQSLIRASPLSKNESESHFNVCRNLFGALSLPALLRCEIYCDGKGMLDPGDLMFPLTSNGGNRDHTDTTNDDIVPIGVVAAGCFSPSRGICYGVGFISASRFIQALMDGTVDGVGMKLSHADVSPKMMLKVHLSKLAPDCVGRDALISLLL